MQKFQALAAAGALLAAAAAPAFSAAPAGLKDALQDQALGLLAADSFRLANGKCTDCPTLKQGLWYFEDDLLAVPKASQALSGYATQPDTVGAVRAWAASSDTAALAHPGLVWIGSPQLFDDVAIEVDGKSVRTKDGASTRLLLVPKIASNLSYWNGATTDFFGQRPVRMRGSLRDIDGAPAFVARTVWPKDFALERGTAPAQPLAQDESLTTFVRKEGGGATSAYSTRVLWERTPGKGSAWAGQPALGIMLNGAQGDDDEAYGGHFAIATGKVGQEGEWSDWIVNNFYNLDSYSEKGIVAAPVPMDNYLMDINSGQQFYRPSYMLVAVLNQARTAQAYQGGVQRVFNNFYRHDFQYKHAGANCSGISLDVFKGLGWNIPERGATSHLKAIAAYGYLSAKDRSLASGRKIYDYLTEEQVRLYPAVAFEAAGADLMSLVGAGPAPKRQLSAFEKQLQSDVEALVLVRIPQVPSSRAMGSAPVFSFDEFMARTPPDRADWKIVPTAPRPFPERLRENVIAVSDPGVVPLPVAGIGMGALLGVGAFIRRRRSKA
ncbi:hypothetical protein [Massilia sp. CF038]|uniref:hypothetical protein n=1 Tax=Massilia sp. CF038 TaxID=1881045 RepID=UPI000924928C|nr:hypothetical protein [Massilia sp. CF038]SHH61521.1 hypothetical protein SAMN05428948_4632 [Massilia sp. CF038]